jgi:tetratricopeptide (TPR) repeat protein
VIVDISSGLASEESYGGWWINNYGILTAKESQYFTRANTVFQNVLRAADKRANMPHLIILRNTAPIASICLKDGSVLITGRTLDLCYQDCEVSIGDIRLAIILGHELAHLANDDFWHVYAFSALQEKKKLSAIYEEIYKILINSDDAANTEHAADLLKKKELQADMYGVLYASMAGFDISKVITQNGALFFNKWINTSKGHPACDQRKAFILSYIQSIVRDIHYFEISCRMYQLGRFYDALTLINAFKEKYPSREVYNLSGLIHFQIAFNALLKCDKNKALRFWLSSILDTTTLAKTTLRSTTDTDFCPEMAEYKIHKEAALRDLEIACQKDPTYVPSHVNFSSALILNGNYVAALAELDPFFKQNTNNASIAANRACALYLIGPTIQVDTLTQAVELSESFIQKEANNAQILYNLYRMYEERGRESKALEIKNRFLAIQPDGRYASMLTKKPLDLQKKDSEIELQWFEKCPVKMGFPDDQTSHYLSGSKPHEFNLGTLSGLIYEIDNNRVLILDDVIEMAEVKPEQSYSESDIVNHYGQPLRALNTFCETKVMIYRNFAVDIVDEIVRQVVFFENNEQ